ncbi:MAG: hypothetical protein ABSH50_24425 [Bryobacteraceae bacterium]
MRSRKPRRSVPLHTLRAPHEICLEAPDHSTVRKSAIQFFQLSNSSNPAAQAARLTEQFIAQNRTPLSLMDAHIERDYDGSDVFLALTTGSSVGAVPLLSPTSARHDYGLVVQPRFPWAGIGPMLAEMGWRIVPSPLRLPLLKRSERRVPPWVISSMVFARLHALLGKLERRFEIVEETRAAPRGAVRWDQYATNQLPRARLLDVPCRFPDLRDDRQLKGAIRLTLERQIRSLETQREQGGFVHRLILFGEQLLSHVRGTPPYFPPAPVIQGWLHRPLDGAAWLDGLQAIEWTLEERGLAGLSDLEGIPWTMSMDQFFEAWIETILRNVARHVGGHLKVGRNRETTASLIWEPAYLGSQKSLMPDLWLESEDRTLIVDAKYKRHWEELQRGSWSSATDLLREEHRLDLLQVLAYGNLARTKSVTVCLVYPCLQTTWESLQERGRLFHVASVPVPERILTVWLTAIPMNAAVDRVTMPFTRQLRMLRSVQLP